MADNGSQQGAKVVPFRPQRGTQASEKKWGKAVMERGFRIRR